LLTKASVLKKQGKNILYSKRERKISKNSPSNGKLNRFIGIGKEEKETCLSYNRKEEKPHSYLEKGSGSLNGGRGRKTLGHFQYQGGEDNPDC